MYYIYSYVDPRTNLPFYIGKGKNNRKFNHILREKESRRENREKYKIIQELKSLNLLPIIIELENNILNEDDAYNREDYYIKLYGRRNYEKDGILTNKTLGGKHPPVPVWTEAKKKQHSKFNKTFWTDEERLNHRARSSACVVDQLGNQLQIPLDEFDAMPRMGDMSNWKYVHIRSKEAANRKSLRTVT